MMKYNTTNDLWQQVEKVGGCYFSNTWGCIMLLWAVLQMSKQKSVTICSSIIILFMINCLGFFLVISYYSIKTMYDFLPLRARKQPMTEIKWPHTQIWPNAWLIKKFSISIVAFVQQIIGTTSSYRYKPLQILSVSKLNAETVGHTGYYDNVAYL